MDSRLGRLDSIGGGIMEGKADNMMSGSSSPMGAFMSAIHNPFGGFRNYGKKFSKRTFVSFNQRYLFR